MFKTNRDTFGQSVVENIALVISNEAKVLSEISQNRRDSLVKLKV